MWKPGEVVTEHRCRAVGVFSLMLIAIIAYSGWLFHKAAEKAKAPDTSIFRCDGETNIIYTYPDLWICPYVNYGCDDWELEEKCVDSAWMTEGGVPYAAFYPSEKLDQLHQVTTDELRIEATPELTSIDSEGNYVEDGRGHCVVFKMSSATAFVGLERDLEEYLDYVHLDMYWYPGGFANSTTCVAEGQEQSPHRDFLYGFLVDSGGTSVSPGIPLSYTCTTNTSDSHIINLLGIGLSSRIGYKSSDIDISSYTTRSRLLGGYIDTVNPNITMPYAHLSMEIKQDTDSWEIVTEANPYEYAEMIGNIGGFWDILLILWPLFFVAATRQDPHLKPRTFKKSVVRGIERTAGITKAIARPGPIRRSGSVEIGDTSRGLDDFREERSAWEPPAFEQQAHA